eukprot:TRINITY_DN16932_c0_g1_i1.p1 TRINITY_DN16932_c0_g1~~TRINITY_DN16932_c0_g1_i1.p1  ORF type:complete len:733 (+),score=171.67 TRINITY_DN16932_c0_g1_i1:135-2333(+)
MGRTNVRVFVRARPSAHRASDIFSFDEAGGRIKMHIPVDVTPGFKNHKKEEFSWKFEKVLSHASQDTVFNACAEEVVKSVLEGFNGTVIAYGQTGAGKTHTMTGGHAGFDDRGLVPRAISYLYSGPQVAEKRAKNNISIRLSYVEIYNELMFDLLADIGVSEQSGDLSIVENAKGDIQVRGLTKQLAANEEEALHIFFQGDTNRRVAEHSLNKGSTRSHCVFTIHVESQSSVESNAELLTSKLHLVDLAGSERVKKTGTDGVMLKEATYINKSLAFLEQVVHALESKHRDHVPYRQSKLTHMLKDSLGGNHKTTMIANIWPESDKVEETASTLRFATRMKNVANDATVNVQLDPDLLIRKYEQQIKELKQELAMQDTLAGRKTVQYDEYSPKEAEDLEGKVMQYLSGDLEFDDMEVTSRRMFKEGFKIFRNLWNGRPVQPVGQAASAGFGVGAGDDNEDPAGATGGGTAEGFHAAGDANVGEDEEGRGISVGMAPANSKPKQEERGQKMGDSGEYAEGGRTEMRGAPRGGGGGGGEEERPPEKQAAFAEWKSKEGAQFEEAFDRHREQLKVKRQEMRDSMVAANQKKREIDDAKERLASKQAEKDQDAGGDDEYIDEEKYALMKLLKDTKQQYKEAYEHHQAAKYEVNEIEKFMKHCKNQVVMEFEAYYEQRYGSSLKATATRSGPEGYDAQEPYDLQSDRLETQQPEDFMAYVKAKKSVARTGRQHRGFGR